MTCTGAPPWGACTAYLIFFVDGVYQQHATVLRLTPINLGARLGVRRRAPRPFRPNTIERSSTMFELRR